MHLFAEARNFKVEASVLLLKKARTMENGYDSLLDYVNFITEILSWH